MHLGEERLSDLPEPTLLPQPGAWGARNSKCHGWTGRPIGLYNIETLSLWIEFINLRYYIYNKPAFTFTRIIIPFLRLSESTNLHLHFLLDFIFAEYS